MHLCSTKAFKNTRYENIFQSSLQTELSSKIRLLSIIQYIMNITLQLQSSLTQLSLRLKRCFYLVSHLIRCLNSSFLSRIIVYVSSLVFVFFVLTQSKSVTDSIKELLSTKEMISSSSFLDVICNKKEMEC